MSGTLFEISAREDLDPGRAALPALLAIQANAADLTPAMEEIGGMLVTSTQDRFEHGVDPMGIEWPVSGRAESENGQTLIDHGHLRDSITFVADSTSVQVGTNLVYGAIHQFGGVIEGKSGPLMFSTPGGGFAMVESVELPKREFLGVSPADDAEATLILEDHLMAGVEGGAA